MLEAMEPREAAARAARVEAMAAEMRTDMEGNGRKQRLYQVDVHIDGGTQVQQFNQSVIRAVSGAVAYNLANDRRERVDFNDTEDTRQRLSEYAEACSICGYLPGMSGACAYAFKCSRSWVSKFMRDNPTHPTTLLLGTVREAFADALLQSGLLGAANPAMSIFALKNAGAGYVDKPEAEGVEVEDDDGGEMSVEDIYRRYAGDNNDDSI